MPPAPLAIRVKTSPLLRGVVPARLAIGRAERRGQEIWERSAVEREQAIAAMERVLAGTPRAEQLPELARAWLIEEQVDRGRLAAPLVGQARRTVGRDLQQALSADRGVLLSACHMGPYYRLQCVRQLDGPDTYLVPGAWFFEPPSSSYWGRRLARWRKGTRSRLVPARGSFRIIQALLERGERVLLFFDMPGARETRFLGKPVMLADGTAQLAVRADALVVPLRARRERHQVWVDVAAPIDPRGFAGVDQLIDALAALHERWILERPATMADPRTFGREHGASAQAWLAPGAASACARGQLGALTRRERSAGHDDAEVLRVDRAGLPMGERRWRTRRDADAGFAVAGVEDVRAVPRRGHPRGDDRAGCRQVERSPGDVLADFEADARAGDVAGVAQSRQRRLTARPVVFEVVAEGHAHGVRLSGTAKPLVRSQRSLAVGGAFTVDQAQGGGADQREVGRGGVQAGVGAGAVAVLRARALVAASREAAAARVIAGADGTVVCVAVGGERGGDRGAGGERERCKRGDADGA